MENNQDNHQQGYNPPPPQQGYNPPPPQGYNQPPHYQQQNSQQQYGYNPAPQYQYPPAPVPPSINKWNWGAFLFMPFWGWGNKVMLPFYIWLGYIALSFVGAAVPVISSATSIGYFVAIIIFGVKGNEMAWRTGNFRTIEEFETTQRTWNKAGKYSFFISIALSVIYMIIITFLILTNMFVLEGMMDGFTDYYYYN